MAIDPPDYRTLFEAAPGLYLALTPTFCIVAVSDAYLKATFVERQNVLGRSMFDVFPDNPDDPEADGVRNLRTSLERVVATGRPDVMAVQKYDVRDAESGGGFVRRYWSPVNSPVFAPTGELKYIIHRAEDVTDFVMLKERHGQQRDSLMTRTHEMEMEVVCRSQELQSANRQLMDLNKKLDEVDRLKTQFFSNVSHELRTPLTLILGPVDKLMRTFAQDPGTIRELSIIQRNARTLLKQVNDLLDVARSDAGKLKLIYTHVDVAGRVRTLVGHFDSLAAERHIHVDVSGPTQLLADLDGDKLDRVVLNLLSNAFKFTPSDGRITCHVGSDPACAEALLIQVGDSGLGIPESHRQSVFERFTQVDSGDKRQVGGTGLGLAIVRDFVTLHGGSVTIGESKDGGALFDVRLPQHAPEGTVVREAQVRNVALGYLESTRNDVGGVESDVDVATVDSDELCANPTALVVDDNAELRTFIRNALSPQFRVYTAPGGKQALELLRKCTVDVIVTDMMMPGMTGQELLAKVRANPKTQKVPVIVVTARADEQLRIDLLKEGAQDYILKPFAAEELLVRVNNLAAIHRTRSLLQDELDQSTTDIESLARQLADQRQRERQAVAARDDFLAVAAHELRTPVTALFLQTQNLLRRAGRGQLVLAGPGNLQERLHTLHVQSSRLTNLIEEMLDVATVQINNAGLNFDDVSLNDVMAAACESLSAAAKAGVLDRVTVHAQTDIVGRWDAKRLERIFINLIGNALKYGNDLPVDVYLNAEGDSARVAVIDHGIGIGRDDLQKLFKPFGRAVSSRHYGGLGMGLYIVKQLVEAHGGFIDVTSEAGKGACFAVTLPLEQIERPELIPRDASDGAILTVRGL